MHVQLMYMGVHEERNTSVITILFFVVIYSNEIVGASISFYGPSIGSHSYDFIQDNNRMKDDNTHTSDLSGTVRAVFKTRRFSLYDMYSFVEEVREHHH